MTMIIIIINKSTMVFSVNKYVLISNAFDYNLTLPIFADNILFSCFLAMNIGDPQEKDL